MTSYADLLQQVEQLPVGDRWQIVKHILRSLEQEQAAPSTDWHAALRETYGILADDPIERPPQLPWTEREPFE